MAKLVGKAPLSLVRMAGGSMEYVYAGQPVPQGADDADAARLVDEGFLVEVGDDVAPVEVAVVEGVGDPGLVNAEPVAPVAVERPARAAAKEAWVDFAVAKGADRGEAEAATKQELVERFGDA